MWLLCCDWMSRSSLLHVNHWLWLKVRLWWCNWRYWCLVRWCNQRWNLRRLCFDWFCRWCLLFCDWSRLFVRWRLSDNCCLSCRRQQRDCGHSGTAPDVRSCLILWSRISLNEPISTGVFALVADVTTSDGVTATRRGTNCNRQHTSYSPTYPVWKTMLLGWVMLMSHRTQYRSFHR